MALEQKAADDTVSYLMQTVTEALADGLAKISNLKGDPIQNLGNYLLDSEAHKEDISKAAKEKENWLRECEKFKKCAPILKAPEPEIELPTADNVASLLMKVCQVMKDKCSASAVYIGIVRPNNDAEGDEDNEMIVYEASTDPAQLDRVLIKGEGVVWDVLQEEENEEEEDPENPKPPKERKILHIPSLLVNGPYRERVHFWDRPVTGAFLATPLRYDSYLFVDALKAPLPPGWPEKPEQPKEKDPVEDAAAEEEVPEAEEVEVIPDPPTKPVTLILCMDSTLTSLDFEDNIPWIRTQASVLEERLINADQQEFLKHRKAEENLKAESQEDVNLGEINNLSHLVHIEKEILDKYYAIAIAFGLDAKSMLYLNGKPSWRKVLAEFQTLKKPIQVEDQVALQGLVNELHESSPSYLTAVLKGLADSISSSEEKEVVKDETTDDTKKETENAA